VKNFLKLLTSAALSGAVGVIGQSADNSHVHGLTQIAVAAAAGAVIGVTNLYVKPPKK